MKTHAPELSRIAKDQGAILLLQDKVIVFLRAEIRRFRSHGSTHAEMKAENSVTRKSEEHLFAARDRFDQPRAGQLPNECSRVCSAEDSFSRMQLHGADFRAQTGIPLFPIKFDFGEFWHALTLSRL